MSSPLFQLRPAEPGDRPHLQECFSTSHPEFHPLPEEHRALIIASQFETQEAGYRQRFPMAVRQIITTATNEKAGMLWTDRREDEIRILDFVVLPEYRRTGIGGAVIRSLQSGEASLPLSIHVETAGGHIPFFEKRGFVRKEEFPSTVLMEWKPS